MKSFARLILKTICRFFPQERGKFKILNDVYFRHLSPATDLWVYTNLLYNIKMKLNIGEFLQAHLFLFGSYELPSVKFIRKFLINGGNAVDVGAQIGYLTIVMATSCKTQLHVYSFEPEPYNISQFNTNISLNALDNITLIPKAVTSTLNPIKLFLAKDNNSGTHSTISSDPNVSSDFITVDSTTLDEFVRDQAITKLDLIKIDVEGAELDVIKGAREVLTLLHPALIIELSESIQQSRGFSTIEFKAIMLELGYDPYLISDRGLLYPTEMNREHIMDNVVFIHQSNKTQLSHLLLNPI